MAQVVRFEGDDGSYMLVQVTEERRSVEPTSKGVSGEGVARRLEDSLASVRGAATALLATVEGMPKKPDEVSLELSLSFEVEGGIVVAKGSAKAEASVTLTWRRADA